MARARLSDAEREARRRQRAAFSFSSAAYQHYDTSRGFGSWQEWQGAAEARAEGRNFFHGTYQQAAKQTKDMVLLELEVMPTAIEGLKTAFRKMANKLHPDHGGDAKAFMLMFAAYERLVRFY